MTLALALWPAAASARQGAAPDRQDARPAKQPAAPAAAKPWSLKMSEAAPHTFTLKSKEANVSEVAAELSRLSGVPVSVGPQLAKQKLTLEFGGMNLVAALRMLAPQSYVDYVAGGDGGAEPKPLAAYLLAAGEPQPSATAAVRATTEAILIEGNTEEGTDAEPRKEKEEENPLSVSYANNYLSVRARKQPLTVVLFKIASEVGVPFEMRHETSELVDVEFSNYTLEQALRSLSPGVRFYYRLDLQTFQMQPLRLALLPPASARLSLSRVTYRRLET